jgi:O-acetylhomoserine/O-acetylserine sulfhydrylase-like pyridoxal-dependent enzyme
MIVQTQCTSFKAECYQGIHDLLNDTIKMALYISTADLGASTTAYTATGETSGTGYSAGGAVMSGVTINTDGSTAYVNFSNVVWNPAAFTARGALIYNASKANRAIAVLDFGADKTPATTFTVSMPANTANSALIRSA